jgi:hypothetical protein
MKSLLHQGLAAACAALLMAGSPATAAAPPCADAAAEAQRIRGELKALISIYETKPLRNLRPEVDTNLHYFNEAEMAAARTQASADGRVLSTQSGQTWSTQDALLKGSTRDRDVRGSAIYGLDENGRMALSNTGEYKRIHHSSFRLQHGFGQIKTMPDGRISEIDNFSGHFQPDEQQFLAQLLALKRQGYAFDQARISVYYPQAQTSAFALFKKHEALFRYLGVDDFQRISVRSMPNGGAASAPAPRRAPPRDDFGSAFDFGF